MEPIKEGYTRITTPLYHFSGLSKIDPEVLSRAALRGSKVHEICDAIIEGLGIPAFDDEISGYIDSFISWNDKHFIQKPERFYCDEYMITGECDGIYEEEDGLVLVDFKTPLNESKTWMLQASAYMYLAKKSGYDIKRIEMVKICKKGNPPKVYVYEPNFELYLSCLFVYEYFYKNAQEENVLDYL